MSEDKQSQVRVENAVTAKTPATQADLQIYQQDAAVLLDVGAAHGDLPHTNVKLAKDGHTVLVPQPSDDPSDPLNWSWLKKHGVLMAIGLAAFVADFQAASAPACILFQGVEWNMSPNHVNEANNLNILFVGVGGVLVIPALFFWGRAPVMFWCIFVGTMFTLGCALAPDFKTFYAMKALQGISITGGQTSGLAFIHDMFFFHEQARKIGIWTFLFIASPYFGPMFANYILAGTGSWRAVYWEIFGIGCLNLILMVLFLDETWYRRDIEAVAQPPRGNRLFRIIGLWQIRHHAEYFGTVNRSVRRLVAVVVKPIILPIMVYYLLSFMWAVGINQTSAILFAAPVSQHGYGFGPEALGHIYFAPILGVVLGEVFGHFFNDFVATRYIRKHEGVFVPEARLWPIYLSAVFMIPGLVLLGQTLNLHLSWVGIAIGWGMFVFGCMLASVAITAYALDSYPTASGEVSALINLARLLGGFSVGYFQLNWGIRDGFDVSFGVQAAIVAVGFMIIPILHIWGSRMRHKAGPLKL